MANMKLLNSMNDDQDEEETILFDETSLMNGQQSRKNQYFASESLSHQRDTKCKKFGRTLVLCASMLGLGLAISIPGPTLLYLRTRTNASIAHISYIFITRSIGYITGSLLGGIILDRIGKRDKLLIGVALFLTAIGMCAAPWVTSLILLCLLISFSGFGMGFLDTGGNVCCLKIWGNQSGPYMQAIHFAFGFGAFLAPLLATPFLSTTALSCAGSDCIGANEIANLPNSVHKRQYVEKNTEQITSTYSSSFNATLMSNISAKQYTAENKTTTPIMILKKPSHTGSKLTDSLESASGNNLKSVIASKLSKDEDSKIRPTTLLLTEEMNSSNNTNASNFTTEQPSNLTNATATNDTTMQGISETSSASTTTTFSVIGSSTILTGVSTTSIITNQTANTPTTTTTTRPTNRTASTSTTALTTTQSTTTIVPTTTQSTTTTAPTTTQSTTTTAPTTTQSTTTIVPTTTQSTATIVPTTTRSTTTTAPTTTQSTTTTAPTTTRSTTTTASTTPIFTALTTAIFTTELYNLSNVTAPTPRTVYESTALPISTLAKPKTTWDISTVSPSEKEIVNENGTLLTDIYEAVMHVDEVQWIYSIIAGIMAFVSFVMCAMDCCGKSYPDARLENDITELVSNTRPTNLFKAKFMFGAFLFFLLYVGTEVAYGQFIASFSIHYWNFSESQGAMLTSTYWGAMALGRGLSIPLSKYLSPTIMISIEFVIAIVSCIGLVGAMVIKKSETSLWILSATLGVGLSCIFPSGILWIEKHVRVSGKLASIFVVGGALGEMIIPVIVGFFFDFAGPMSLMYGSLTCLIACLITYLLMQCLVSRKASKYHSIAENGNTMYDYDFSNSDEGDDSEPILQQNGRKRTAF